MRGALKSLVLAAAVCLLPSAGFAQATITGTVRDTSRAVLPGVTVEAASPALLAPRVVVTDGSGIYRIIDLPPGSYTIAFTLSGFSRTVRDDVAISGAGVFTVPAEMRVGGLEETVTVTSETPVVDVQSTRRETVLSAEVISTLPATRNYGAILAAVPGIEVSGVVGGSLTSAQTTPEITFFTARGGAPTEGRMMIDGMNVAAAFSGGGVSSLVYNTSDTTEIQVLIAGGLGENETGGPSMNLIPRSGGNRFAGQAFFNAAGDWSRSENIDDELRSFNITRGPALRNSWDVNGSLGGPIRRDRLWFYGTVRNYGNARVVEGALGGNLHAGDPNSWAYAADTSVAEVRNVQGRDVYSVRLTGQTGKHRITFSQENQYRCDGSTRMRETSGCRQRGEDWTGLGNLTLSGEAAGGYYAFPYYVTQATWTAPMTNRLLLEAGFSRFSYINAAGGFGMVAPDAILDLIPVTEQSAVDGHRANFTYRAVNNFQDNYANPNNFRASAAYVSGAHNLKVGYQGAYQVSDGTVVTNSNLMNYRFNRGNPNQFTIRLPNWQTANRTVQHSAFVQDQWTVKRLTLQGALRYDHAYSWSPAEHNGTTETSRFNPAPITFDRTVSVRGYDDLSPRVGVAYDLFGTGRTALKAHIGRYLSAATNDSNYVVNNPANRIQTTMSRSWVDNNGDKVVDCDILNPVAQAPASTGSVDTCGAVTGNNLRFANALTGLTQVNPEILGGWGVRPYDWQFSAGIQQELLPRVSVEVSYARRWWGNFFVTDNQARTPDHYETWIATAPLDPRLPGGGGYELVEYEIRPEFNGIPAQNYVTFETDFGPARTSYWNGVDVTGSARMRNGLTFQGGTSTGRQVTDRCATVVHIDSPNPRNCRTVLPFRTTFRGSAAYTIPKVDVLVSSIVRLSPAPQINASYNFPNTYVAEQLGHLPAGGTANGNQTVALLNPGQMYAERQHRQVDMRFAKVFRFGGKRADFGVDLYNLFNVNTPTGYDGTYDVVPAEGLGPGGEWLRPTGIVQPRFARFNLTVNF